MATTLLHSRQHTSLQERASNSGRAWPILPPASAFAPDAPNTRSTRAKTLKAASSNKLSAFASHAPPELDTSRLNVGPANKLLVPKFWTGTPATKPSAYTIDCGGRAPPVAELAATMKAVFAEQGIMRLTNTGLHALSEMKPYVDVLIPETMLYSGGANSRGALDEFFLEVGAPSAADLHYHHEMAYVSRSPETLGISCTAGLGTVRGATFFSDSLKVQAELLSTSFGKKLKEKGLCYTRTLTDAMEYEGRDQSQIYNHWQTSFKTDDAALAEERARAAGLEVEWGVDHNGLRCMRTRYYASAFEYCRRLDRNVIYSSVADANHWFDSWPGVCELPAEHRPMEMTFGDNTPISISEWRQFVALYDKYGFPVEWQTGDVVVFCNFQFAHGRKGFELELGEERQIGVVLGKAFDRVGDRMDKWLAQELEVAPPSAADLSHHSE